MTADTVSLSDRSRVAQMPYTFSFQPFISQMSIKRTSRSAYAANGINCIASADMVSAIPLACQILPKSAGLGRRDSSVRDLIPWRSGKRRGRTCTFFPGIECRIPFRAKPILQVEQFGAPPEHALAGLRVRPVAVPRADHQISGDASQGLRQAVTSLARKPRRQKGFECGLAVKLRLVGELHGNIIGQARHDRRYIFCQDA